MHNSEPCVHNFSGDVFRCSDISGCNITPYYIACVRIITGEGQDSCFSSTHRREEIVAFRFQTMKDIIKISLSITANDTVETVIVNYQVKLLKQLYFFNGVNNFELHIITELSSFFFSPSDRDARDIDPHNSKSLCCKGEG